MKQPDHTENAINHAKSDDEEIDLIVRMLDEKLSGGVSRLKLEVSDDLPAGSVNERYHHGRCDVGSPFARGDLPDCD